MPLGARKLKWFGHVCLPLVQPGKDHLASTVRGARRSGRQRMGWENIRKGSGLDFLLLESQRAVGDRQKWRQLFARSLVMPL